MTPRLPKPVFPVAHRGASAYAPENTVAAFDLAISMGVTAVEFDLRLTADNVPIVIHDATLDRTTSGTGPVNQQKSGDILALDAGSWKDPRFASSRIPTFDEALSAIGPHARPIIELKVPVPPELVLAALRKFDLESKVLLITFHHEWLPEFRRASKRIPLGLLTTNWTPDLPQKAKSLDADTLLLHTDVLGTSQVAAAEALGLEVWCFTPNDVGQVAACASMGATGIITDYPDLIRTR